MAKSAAAVMHERLYHREPVFSFEFFPPKDEAGRLTLERSLERLAPLNPAFVSVTCGAAGGTRDLTRDLVLSMQGRYDFAVLAHITATGYSKRELADLVVDYRRRGIMNFLALRGDPPRDRPDWRPPPDQYAHAAEVVEVIRAAAPDASIGVAGYPETHPEAPDARSDLLRLAEKVEAGADFVITQLFFDNELYFDFVGRARKIGVRVPILPGLMPITRPGQAERFRELCRVDVPVSLAELLAPGDEAYARGVGVSYAAAQMADLLRRGACGIHLYTLNQSRTSHALYRIARGLGW
ncbi:MAG: methylenetetrahydrofolate reductase [Planctomycetota bacterium]|jgi:methylenetetrahydrofolate reductase (NADPH)|nr:methylenetetrahydrofolate reductase [Planctomycetota bacterium]